MRYLPVRYEDMVADQEAECPENPRFHRAWISIRDASVSSENTRYARTASYAQVTEKLYDRSRYRYQPICRISSRSSNG